MLNSVLKEFVERLDEEQCVIFRDKKFFLSGCPCKFDEKGKVLSVSFEVFEVTTKTVVFYAEKNTIAECIDAFLDAAIFDGKRFYDVADELIPTDDWL